MSIILCLFPATLTNFDLINVPIVLINSLSVAEKRRQGVGVLVPPISLNALLLRNTRKLGDSGSLIGPEILARSDLWASDTSNTLYSYLSAD